MNIFTIFCVPIPLKRHRSHKNQMYDPSKKDKKIYQLAIKPQLPENFKPFSKNIEARFEFHMPIPASYSKRKSLKLEGSFHDKKPDLSNLIKFVEDAFNGILWEDDSKISYLFSTKKYSCEPKTLIYITEHAK